MVRVSLVNSVVSRSDLVIEKVNEGSKNISTQKEKSGGECSLPDSKTNRKLIKRVLKLALHQT